MLSIITRLDSVPECTVYAKSIGINCVLNSAHRERSNNSRIEENKQNGDGDYWSLWRSTNTRKEVPEARN